MTLVPLHGPDPQGAPVLLEFDVGDPFDDFWRLYPRKVGKKLARVAFARALRTAPLERILAGARRYAAVCDAQGTETQFIAYPTTWLTQERWDDEDEARPQLTPSALRVRDNLRMFVAWTNDPEWRAHDEAQAAAEAERRAVAEAAATAAEERRRAKLAEEARAERERMLLPAFRDSAKDAAWCAEYGVDPEALARHRAAAGDVLTFMGGLSSLREGHGR